MFIQLYIAKVPIGSGSGENFPDPDPIKKVRIRIGNPDYLNDFSLMWLNINRKRKRTFLVGFALLDEFKLAAKEHQIFLAVVEFLKETLLRYLPQENEGKIL